MDYKEICEFIVRVERQADSVDEDCFFDYMTPWGEVKYGAIATTDVADGTTEERCFENDGTTTVKDAYLILSFTAKYFI